MYVTLEICRRCDAKPFSKSHVRADPPNRIDPKVVVKIVDRWNVLRRLAENPAILKIVKTIRTPAVDVANWLPKWAHPLRDRIRRRLDWKTVAMCETSLSRTVIKMGENMCMVSHIAQYEWSVEKSIRNKRSRERRWRRQQKKRDKANKTFNYHIYSLRVDFFRNNIVLVGQILDHFMQGSSFDFFPLQIA